jgi:hypothetical protein
MVIPVVIYAKGSEGSFSPPHIHVFVLIPYKSYQMTKRPRSDSEDSLPELEKLVMADSDDEIELAEPDPHDDAISDSDASEELEDHSLMSESSAIPVERLSMREEIRGGIIDSEGNIIQAKQNEATDAWLDNAQTVDASAMEKARMQARARDEYWSSVESGSQGPIEPIENYLYKLEAILLPGETARVAMDRFLGKKPTGSGPAFKSAIRAKRKTAVTEQTFQEKDIKSFDHITEVCDALIAKGFHGVLTETKDRIAERLQKFRFEYRWKGHQDEQVYGPFLLQQLIAWNNEGCFNANPIEIRYAGSNQAWRDFISPV